MPPRLSAADEDEIKTLSALMHGYPRPGTYVDDEITIQGVYLSAAAPENRAGSLLVVRAVAWYAVSGMEPKKEILDGLIESVEEALPHFAGVSCAHGGHAVLPDTGPEAVELGVMLRSTGGRRSYEHEYRTPLEEVVCPAFMAEIAEETLKALREQREKLFGDPDTSQADAE